MRYLLIFLAFPALTLLASCKGCKDGNNIDVPGGKGGSGTLRVTLKHHSYVIDTAGIVYMAYGIDAPADGSFDDSVRCVTENGQHVAVFSGLRKGQYYLYGQGFDKDAGGMIAGGNGIRLTKEGTVDYVLSISTHLY